MSGTFTPDGWFEFVTRVQPHHTDYAGIVWHGTYLTWLETARVEYLRSRGIGYEDLVKAGLDLPVVDLQIRYHQAIRMGTAIRVRTRLQPQSGVRLTWDYALTSIDQQTVYATATVNLIALQRPLGETESSSTGAGKILRRLPTVLQQALDSP